MVNATVPGKAIVMLTESVTFSAKSPALQADPEKLPTQAVIPVEETSHAVKKTVQVFGSFDPVVPATTDTFVYSQVRPGIGETVVVWEP
jgi:hypothetical protein